MDTAAFLLDIPVDGRDTSPGHRDHLDQQHGCIDPVLAVDMAANGQSAGRLPAQQRICLAHLRGDMFKSNRNLITLFPESTGDAVQHVCRCHVANHRSMHPAVPDHVVIQQDQDIVGMQIPPGIIYDSQPVRVSVRGDPDVSRIIHDAGDQRPESTGAGGRHLPAEQRVMAVVDRLDITACGVKQGLERNAGHSVHGIQRHFHLLSLDRFAVDLLKDAVNIFIERIDFLDQSFLDRLLILHAMNLLRINTGKDLLEFIRHFPARISAARREDLDSVVQGWVMAGCDHHPIGKFVFLDIIHDQRCRRCFVDQHRCDAFPCKDLSAPAHGFLGQETAVISDEDALLVISLPLHPYAHSFAEKLDVGFREFISYDGAPSAGPKLYHAFPPAASPPPMMITTSVSLPGSMTGILSLFRPSTKISRTPLLTCSGLRTSIW